MIALSQDIDAPKTHSVLLFLIAMAIWLVLPDDAHAQAKRIRHCSAEAQYNINEAVRFLKVNRRELKNDFDFKARRGQERRIRRKIDRRIDKLVFNCAERVLCREESPRIAMRGGMKRIRLCYNKLNTGSFCYFAGIVGHEFGHVVGIPKKRLGRHHREGGDTVYDFQTFVTDLCQESGWQRQVEPPRWGSWIRASHKKRKCVHKQGGGDDWRNGLVIHLWDCKAGPWANKAWFYDSATRYIRSTANPDKCLHKRSPGWENGNRIHLWDCSGGSRANKTWIHDSGSGLIRAAENPSKCLHKRSPGWRNGNRIHLWDCAAGTAGAKSWRLHDLP
ncbi:MAG: ricin-type beta-trefoil lectin domain protein [Gammaproteobacteria bacterium]|nr:ricin-type beta-trefoil lectin domain protein [Gammaproteobacteria bacterium]